MFMFLQFLTFWYFWNWECLKHYSNTNAHLHWDTINSFSMYAAYFLTLFIVQFKFSALECVVHVYAHEMIKTHGQFSDIFNPLWNVNSIKIQSLIQSNNNLSYWSQKQPNLILSHFILCVHFYSISLQCENRNCFFSLQLVTILKILLYSHFPFFKVHQLHK